MRFPYTVRWMEKHREGAPPAVRADFFRVKFFGVKFFEFKFLFSRSTSLGASWRIVLFWDVLFDTTRGSRSLAYSVLRRTLPSERWAT